MPVNITSEDDQSIIPAMLQDDLNRYEKQRLEIDLIASDLLCDRGEDKLTAKACERILHLIRNA